MRSFPDAPWVVDYDKYFNLFYQCVPADDEEDEDEEDEEWDN